MNTSTQYIINHVFLPPRLPQAGDSSKENDLALLDLVIHNAKLFVTTMPSDAADWGSIIHMLENMRIIYSASALDKAILQDLFSQLTEGGTLVVPVRAQNACVFIRQLDAKTIYEFFEIDPPNEKVMETTGRLIRRFPGPAFEISKTPASLAFKKEILTFLVDMDVVTVGSAPSSKKAGSEVYEAWDTADPHYITQLLTAIIYGAPESKPADVERIEKRIRNEILVESGASMPWRRSSLWLIIRVALQTTLQRANSSQGQTKYKVFMLSLMADFVLSNNDLHSLSNDVLVCFQNKVVRRLGKISDLASDDLLKKATGAISKAREVLEARWKDIRSQQALSPPWSPESLDISQDTNISLLSSKDYLYSRLQQTIPSATKFDFQPSETPRLNDEDFLKPDLVSMALSKDPLVALADIEEFAIERLEIWVNKHFSESLACIALGECILHYATVAQLKYQGNPEDQSLMLLTIFLLWSALDCLAVKQLPLLADYFPDISKDILNPLLLRSSNSIKSLIYLQSYIHERQSKACQGSVFDNKLSTSSFAIRYFCTSSLLMDLKKEIEDAAQDERAKKQEEFDQLKAKYTQLIVDAESQEHEYKWTLDGHSYHPWQCSKCLLQTHASNLTIGVHEWPLPQDELQAQATVFELQCPLIFQIWRSTTYTIFNDICSTDLSDTATTSHAAKKLADYIGLKKYYKGQTRIAYASKTMPFINTHYSTQKISNISDNPSSIFVNNGLNYGLYDIKSNKWANTSFVNSTVNGFCRFSLPLSSPYYVLQYALEKTTHSANQAIADQAKVPPKLSINEYIEFGTLRCGAMVQWLNILRELRAQILSFNCIEVHMLIAQASLQIGNIEHDELKWHEILKQFDFGLALLFEIDNLLSSIESNWHHIITLQTMIILTTRLLSSSPKEEVCNHAYLTLQNARRIAFKWMTDLIENLEHADSKNSSILAQQHVYWAAAACRATYDVDAHYFNHLITCDEDIKMFIQCAIHIQDNTFENSIHNELFLARDRRLSHKLATSIWNQIENNRAGLDNAILHFWAEYKCGSNWKPLPIPNERWLTSIISDSSSSIELVTLHYNLLNGTLLINEKPLSRLPSIIVSHPTYIRLLGHRILDVVPSKLPNMDFATRNIIIAPNCFLHFQFPTSDGSLIIQAKAGDDVFELVPHTAFQKLGYDFPVSFITEYAHWLHLLPSLNKGHVTFHPLQSIWQPSQNNWNLTFNTANDTAKLRIGNDSAIVDIRSKSFDMISKHLEAIEVPKNIHITFGTNGTQVELPQYKLEFFLNEKNDLECSTIRNMVVDLNQSSGTMYGLVNQLVLQSKFPSMTRVAAPGSRCVIIPFGEVNLDYLHHHSHITISPGLDKKYFTYHIDNTLGRLVGTTLLSDYYKIYLHACTSFPLPDDLTGNTGIEEALHYLESARCFSFQNLSEEEVLLLQSIAKLTPNIEWHPKNLKIMQTFHWNKLSSLTQHWIFASKVEDIFQFYKQMSPLKKSSLKTFEFSMKSHLLARFDSHTSGLYSSGRKSSPSFSSDILYLCRLHTNLHSCQDFEKIPLLIANISALSHCTSAQLNTVTNLWEQLQMNQMLTNEPFAVNLYSQLIFSNLSNIFLPLYKASQQAQNSGAPNFKMAFLLSTIVYMSCCNTLINEFKDFVPTFLAFSRLQEFQAINPPLSEIFDLSYGFEPNKTSLINLIKKHPLEPPANQLTKQLYESNDQYYDRYKEYLKSLSDQQLENITEFLLQQWPCSLPEMPHFVYEHDLFDLNSSKLKNEISQHFFSWFNNMKLKEFVYQVQVVLDTVHASLTNPIPMLKITSYHIPTMLLEKTQSKKFLNKTLDDLVQSCTPPIIASISESSSTRLVSVSAIKNQNTEVDKLWCLIKQFKQSSQVLHRKYGKALENSLNSYIHYLESNTLKSITKSSISNLSLINEYELQRRKLDNICQLLKKSLSPKTPLEIAMYQAGHWPHFTIISLLNLLSKDKIDITTPLVWKDSIITFAQMLVKLQHSRRKVLLKISNQEEALLKELENVEYEKNAFYNPEWLLIQIDSNFTVRPLQSHIAKEMISPHSKYNFLTQLNMGEGKSAVIIPMVASTLANGERLVRVVVLKSLASQMFDLLVQRLSGLANRQIFYLPFSRDFKPAPMDLENIQALYEMCVQKRGILLIQPEHILSFRLMGIDLAAGTYTEAAKCFFKSYNWLLSKSKDVLDESDEILRATYQLVYTSGLQEPMESHPDRWTIIQEVIGYIFKHVQPISCMYPDGLEVYSTEDYGSPIIRIVDSKAGEALIDSLIWDISNNRFKLIPPHICLAASDFIRGHQNKATAFEILHAFVHNSSTWKHLLLYRGLFSHGLLQFVLQEKRWRVDYGLDLSRTLLAVPYHAKDLPSLRADFGHPDVALLLTCLSYYYGGLTEEQLNQSFELLFKLDDPPLEYNQWVFGHEEIPLSFRDIKGVNLNDENQRKSILGPLFRNNKAVIDFFLSNVVFPRYAKQFPKKLSTSSWDLAETKAQVTTGFSGTNDNQYLLPTSIQQDGKTEMDENDPFLQLATNAKVLSILLQPENNAYYCLKNKNGHSPTGSDFLNCLVKSTSPVRVLLDVGAQMLDLQNTELVSQWLLLDSRLHAIVYFNNDDQLVVMSQKDRHVEKFVTSPYSQKLDLCAVYLDDAHTRGTDLKLPINFRAAVTLGPKLTKDRLVQGCMRMRQLGHGQSVVFFASPEVDRSIRACELSPLSPSAKISSEDILRWAMWQTCKHIQHYLPQWAQQGLNYKRRNNAWNLYESKPSTSDALQELRSSWEEPDAQTLEEMYEGQPNSDATSFHPAFEFSDLKERLDYLGISQLSNSKTDEEQERQVLHEAEQERQRELPPKVEPASSTVHNALKELIHSGIFKPNHNSPFIPLFLPLETEHKWCNALFSTTDFATTVQGSISAGDYLRPVNWILSVPKHRVLIVLSPYEVNELLPMIWKSRYVHLHIYVPRVNQNMKTTEDLKFFSIPPLPVSVDPLTFILDPMLQLNLWAGQLYLKDFETYKRLCQVLGLIGAESGPTMWDSDGFVKPENRLGTMKEKCQMVVSPVTFLKELFSLRRKGLTYTATHMGKILNVKPLEEKDFDH